MLDLHLPHYGFGSNQVSSILQAASFKNSIFCPSLNATWTESHKNLISPIKKAVPGDGQQAFCPFCLCRKDLFSSLSSRLALLGKQNHIYRFRHSEDMGRLASCRMEASSDSLFFVLLGMFKTWDRRFCPFKVAKYLFLNLSPLSYCEWISTMDSDTV